MRSVELVLDIMDWINANCAVGKTVWLFAAEGCEGSYEKFGFEERPMLLGELVE